MMFWISSTATPFQLTRLMRGVTLPLYNDITKLPIFQLTRLMRGVTTRHKCIINIFQFQLTRLMRGVTTK